MELSLEEKEKVAQWVAAGDSLSVVQQKLESELGHRMTFMEVRFLVDDLDLKLSSEPRKVIEKDITKAKVAGSEEEAPAPGKVSVEVDAVVRPGAIVSGSAVFSDGTRATWYLDQFGRLGLDAGTPGYQPPMEDVEEFQVQLQELLRKKGFGG